MSSILSAASSTSRHLPPVIGAGFVAIGVSINSVFVSSIHTAAAVLLVAIGLYGVVSYVSGRRLEQLRHTTKRLWILAVASFVPYGLVAAPSNEQAAAVSNAFEGTFGVLILEATAGSAILCAISVTTLYAMAVYGVHPGRPAPEERILDDSSSD